MTSQSEVSLHFLWLELQRQVPSTDGSNGFHGETAAILFAPLRQPDRRMVSPQSQVVSSKSLLLAKYEEMKAEVCGGQGALASFWGGYRVVPREFEFWQADADAFTIAFRYRRNTTTSGSTNVPGSVNQTPGEQDSNLMPEPDRSKQFVPDLW